MRSRKILAAAVGLLMLTILWWAPADSILVRAADDVLVAEDETVTEDLALFGSIISVDGYVDSDVIAFCRSITVSGIINQDLMGGAETVEITGQVGDDLRIGARYIDVRGPVGDDVIAFCQRFTLGQEGRVGGEVQVWCQKAIVRGDADGNLRISCKSAEIHGHVGGNISVDASTIKLAGAVDGDAELTAESITLLPGCTITGNLKYISTKEINIQEGAQVLGETIWEKTVPEEKPEKVDFKPFLTFLKLAMLAAQIIVGLVLIAISRKQASLMADTLTGHPWKSLGVGIVFLICVPIAALILMVTIIGLPLGLIATFLYLIVLYLSPIVVGLTIGGKIVGAFKNESAGRMVGGLILGLVILRAISFIPAFGSFVQFLVLLFGTGALLYSRKLARDKAKENGLI